MKWRIWLLVALLLIDGGLLLMKFNDRPTEREKVSSVKHSKPVKTNPEATDLFADLQTDRSRYNPGEPVTFTLKRHVPSGKLNVTYYHLNEKIKEETLSNQSTWSWQPPSEDYKGYLVEVKMSDEDQAQTETIAVDVSSDWDRFPRYGFLSEFSQTSKMNLERVISSLNRFHLNGLQFYDWQYEHQQPLKMDGNNPASSWQDVANREISFGTLQQYIDLAHTRNMKTMAYNLLYGSYTNSGLPLEWQLFKDPNKQQPDRHPLPKEWKNDINIMNPTNPWWQDYIIEQQRKIYEQLPFDGWHIDQLGDRGEVFNEWGDRISIPDSFSPFLKKIKEKLSDKNIVMNAVNQYGQASIAQAEPDFLYTEVWDENKTYGDLKKILDENAFLSGKNTSSVLAAYMDYQASDQPGMFNEPGVLLTNSVIFANGGAHLELGEHMLSKEYFPHHQLEMSSHLQNQLVHYYDFLTAYENLLRENVTGSEVTIHSKDGIPLSFDTAKRGHLWVIPKRKDNHEEVLHFINFLDANTLKWRDTDGQQKRPSELKNLTFTIESSKKVKAMWLASPDFKSGKPVPVNFNQNVQQIKFTLPSLTYWDMLVIEYDE